MVTIDREAGTARKSHHPYLHGNFAPIHRVQPLIPCSFSGKIPEELAGGEYVRNGGNPLTNEDLGRDAHWFDGDGMLSGVAFRRVRAGPSKIQPEFVNQYILTDVYISSVTTPSLQTPILPSIATLVNPLSSVVTIILRIVRALLLVLLSHVWGSQQAIKRISVANTNILYHDGRALATCESGPPMRVALPGLETVGWFDGQRAEGEITAQPDRDVFGGQGIVGFMREWTTAHPRVDPTTKELLLFHSTFVPPYIHYSILPSTGHASYPPSCRMLNAPIPGMSSAKMMHDFGVSSSHTVILDLPLSLDPMNLTRNEPVVSYDSSGKSRFGVFPRREPERVRWFETDPCCIFHTANTWDGMSIRKDGAQLHCVNMLACRLTSASLVFSAGDIAAPTPRRSTVEKEVEQCRLYYYQYDMTSARTNVMTHQWALSAIPYEFPSLRDDLSMSAARYIYGCTSSCNFGAALGRAVKIDALVKVDALALIERGVRQPPTQVSGCVDRRTLPEVLASTDPSDPIKVFPMPPGWYAQESRFVPRRDGCAEDDGWLLSYVFDEAQLDADGSAPDSASSELWIIDARNMRDLVACIHLPQRVPYGLHGNWFSEEDILTQRPVQSIRSLPTGVAHAGVKDGISHNGFVGAWMGLRQLLLEFLA